MSLYLAMLLFKLLDTPFDELLNFLVLRPAFVLGNIADFIQQTLWYAQRIAR